MTTPPSILKRDIVGHEWDVMEDIAVSDVATMPLSVAITKMHFYNPLHLPWQNKTFDDIWCWSHNMFTNGGYVLMSRKNAPPCLHCGEAVFTQFAAACGQ